MPHRRLTRADDRTAAATAAAMPGATGGPVPPNADGRLVRAEIRLETERLRITPLGPADIDSLVAYRRDPEIARFQSWDVDYDDNEARQLVDDQPPAGLPDPDHWLQLGLHDSTSQELVGDIGLHTASDQPDTYALGITLAPAYQGQGLATEACEAVLDHLFTAAGAHRVTATCDARNTASSRLLQRLGMRHEARLTDADWCKGEWTTLDGYALLAHQHSSTNRPRPPTTTHGVQGPVDRGWRDHPVRSVSFLGVHTDAFLDMRHLYAYAYGAPLLHEAPGVAWFALADGAELHLYATTDTYHRFFGHAPVPGLLVDDYTRTEQRLNDFGVEWLTDPDTANGRIWRHYRAPDGNVYELMGPANTSARQPPEGPSSS